MLRTTLAVAILAGAAASGTAAMAGTGAITTNDTNIRGAIATVADNAAPTPQDPLSTEQASKFREEVRKGNHKPWSSKVDPKVGAVLPAEVEFYAIGPQWNMTGYKYALVNDETVIVDPNSRKIIRILDKDKKTK